MDKQKRTLLLTVVVLVAVLGLGFAGYHLFSGKAASELAQANAEAVRASEGASSKDVLTLSELDATVYTELGEPVTISSLAGGKPLVVNFWATWCPYCIQEMPDYQKLYAEYGNRVSFAFIDVTDGQRETKEAALSWLAENGFSDLPDYYDTELNASRTFGASSLPLSAVIAADGEVLTLRPGVIDPSLMRGALNSLVA